MSGLTQRTAGARGVCGGAAAPLLAFLCFSLLPLIAAGSEACAPAGPKVFEYAGHCYACKDKTITLFSLSGLDDKDCKTACAGDPQCDTYAIHEIPYECELYHTCNSFLDVYDCLDSTYFTCTENCPQASSDYWTLRTWWVCPSSCVLKEFEGESDVETCAAACKSEPGCGFFWLDSDDICRLYEQDCECDEDDEEDVSHLGRIRTSSSAGPTFTIGSDCVTVMEGWSYKPKPGSTSFYAKHPDLETAFASCQDAHVIVTNQESGTSFCWKYVEGYYVKNEVAGSFNDLTYDTYMCQQQVAAA